MIGPLQSWVGIERIGPALESIYGRPEFLRVERRTLVEIVAEWLVGLLERMGEAAPWLDPVGDALYVILAAVGLLLVVRIALGVRRLLHGSRATPRAAESAPGAGLDSATQRRAADEAARRGNYAAAVRALYLYVVARLHERGVVRYHESKTGGDYLLEARRPEGLAGFLRDVERVVFGGRPCDRALLERLAGVAEAVADGSA